MNENRSVLIVSVLLAVAFLLATIFAMWRIGDQTLRTMGLIFVIALAVALVVVASAFPIRMWRKKDFVGDHYHTDGTKTIVKEVKVLDGRVAEGPKLYQLPAQAQGTAFPDLLRAAFAAGATALPARANRVGAEPDYTETELPEVDLGAEWEGDIRT